MNEIGNEKFKIFKFLRRFYTLEKIFFFLPIPKQLPCRKFVHGINHGDSIMPLHCENGKDQQSSSEFTRAPDFDKKPHEIKDFAPKQ